MVTDHSMDREAAVAAPLADDEIDLGKYIAVLWRWRVAIVAGSLGAGLAALAWGFVQRPTYEAEAYVAIVKSGTQLNFDPKFRTISEADQQTQLTDQAARRKSLTTMAKNLDLAGAVLTKLRDRLQDAKLKPEALLRTVEAVNDGDLIKITAGAWSPEQAALIANTWAQEFERRVNSIYGDSPLSADEMQSQAEALKRDYDTREAALVAHLVECPIERLTRRIADKQQVISGLQEAKKTAVQTVLKNGVESRSEAIAAFVGMQQQARLLVLNKEQEGKSKLLSSYLDAVTQSRLAVFNQQAAAHTQKLTDLYAMQNKIDRLLADATALQARLSAGGAGASRGADLAAILLEASAFSTWSSLPVRLQIPVEQLSASNATPAERLRNLSTLITALENRRNTVQADIDRQSTVLLTNSGYNALDAGAFGQDPLTESVKQKYPSLFIPGELSKEALGQNVENPLDESVAKEVKSILELQDFQGAFAESAADSTLGKIVDQMQREVTQLQSQLEQATAMKQDLIRARDLAFSSYSTLASKVTELNIASRTRGTVVRQAVPAVPPERPVAPRKARNAVLGSMLGLMIAVGFAFYREFTDDTLRNEEQVTALLGLPTIAAIPALYKAGRSSEPAPDGKLERGVEGMRSAATEAFRMLRHNLFASGKRWEVLLVASALPGEGKSTVAANLAILIAGSGKRVTLLDADFRHPAQHAIFGLNNERGLSSILCGSSDNGEGCSHQAANGLRVVPSGPLPADPTMLLESAHLRRWIEHAKTEADVVIIDTTAALGVADALIAAGVTDAILMVVRAGAVSSQDALRAKQRLTATGVPILGVALNAVEALPDAYYADAYGRGRSGGVLLPKLLWRRWTKRVAAEDALGKHRS